MNVTVSDDLGSGNPATGNEPAGGPEHPDLARAREGHRTPIPPESEHPLPDTDSDESRFANLRDWATELIHTIWSGEVWDIQPPSPRELVDRARDGAWWDHDAVILRGLAKTGLVACLVWSVPLYTLAVLGQRFGRAFTALLVAGLICYLI